jgi:hypothetical protein
VHDFDPYSSAEDDSHGDSFFCSDDYHDLFYDEGGYRQFIVTIRCTVTMAAALATDTHGLVGLRSRRRKLLFTIPKKASGIEHCAVAAGRICQELNLK